VFNAPPGLHYGSGFGGAIFNEGGSLASSGTHWVGNSAQGAISVSQIQGGYDGSGFGGAVYSANGTIVLQDCVLSENKIVVGPTVRPGVPGAAGGGAVYIEGGRVSLVSSVLSNNECPGDGGPGGATEGNGGSVFNTGDLSVTNCTFSNNRTIGGAGRGGSMAGNGGAIYNSTTATIVGTTFNGNSAIGGTGAPVDLATSTAGSNGKGGGIFSMGTISLMNCTFYRNMALGGNGQNFAGFPTTDGGPGEGGAIYMSSETFAATNLTFDENFAKGGLGGRSPFMTNSDGTSEGGAIYVSAGTAASVVNTILANSSSGSNCFGTLTDAGHNISSDASCSFSAAGSLNGTDPKLGPLGNYGGPTETIPLLSGSPAIDAADTVVCPTVDQRGIPRPYGAGCDIGAFESAPPYTVNGHVRGYLSQAGVVVNVGSNSVPVDASGFYTFTGLTPGSYTATPASLETRFVPSNRVFQVGPDNPDMDFKAYRLNAIAVETFTNADLQIVYAGDIDGMYRTLASTNLIDWALYSTNRTDTNGVFVVTNLNNGSESSRFFRVVKP
jgi:hypothetical protein